MPVTGTRTVTEMLRGPVEGYFNVPLPADGAVLALAAGVPASGHKFGLSKAGAKVTFTYTESSEEADEDTTPINTIITADSITIEAELWQMSDFLRLAFLSPTGTYFLNAAVTEGLKYGGIAAIPTGAKPSVLLVVPTVADPTMYFCVQIFSSINKAGLAFDLTRKNSASTPIKMESQSVSTRSANNRAGVVWKQLVAS